MRKGKKFFVTNNFSETQELGEKFTRYNLVQEILSGERIGAFVIALYGELGSGKTTFVQGLARGLGIKRRIISPTFIIVRNYRISIKYRVLSIKYFYHIDLYRIEGEKDLYGLGVKEILNSSDNIVAIEWAERMGRLLPKKRCDATFEYLDENKRKVTIKNT